MGEVAGLKEDDVTDAKFQLEDRSADALYRAERRLYKVLSDLLNQLADSLLLGAASHPSSLTDIRSFVLDPLVVQWR